MNAAELQNFLRALNCMSDLDFMDMYADLGFKGQYAMEKFETMRSNFIRWACEIDEATLNKIIEWIKIHRG